MNAFKTPVKPLAGLELGQVINEFADRKNLTPRITPFLDEYDDDEVCFCTGSACQAFTPISEFSGDLPDYSDEVAVDMYRGEPLESVGVPVVCPEKFIEKELYPEHVGEIVAVSVDAQNGILYVYKERMPKTYLNDEVCVQPTNEKMFGNMLKKVKVRRYRWFDTIGCGKDNLKTLSDSKRERMYRGEVRKALGKN